MLGEKKKSCNSCLEVLDGKEMKENLALTVFGKSNSDAVISDKYPEKCFSLEVMSLFTKNDSVIATRGELNPLKSVVIRHLSLQIDSYTEQFIREAIESENPWAKIVFLRKLYSVGKNRMLKVQFQTSEMADRAESDGILILYQFVKPESIDKEISSPASPHFNNCTQDHKKNSHKKDVAKRINSSKTNQQDKIGQRSTPKCANCQGNHHTSCFKCPIKKEEIIATIDNVMESVPAKFKATPEISASSVYDFMTDDIDNDLCDKMCLDMNAIWNMIPANERPSCLTKMKVVYSAAHHIAKLNEKKHPGTYDRYLKEFFRLNGLPENFMDYVNKQKELLHM